MGYLCIPHATTYSDVQREACSNLQKGIEVAIFGNQTQINFFYGI